MLSLKNKEAPEFHVKLAWKTDQTLLTRFPHITYTVCMHWAELDTFSSTALLNPKFQMRKLRPLKMSHSLNVPPLGALIWPPLCSVASSVAQLCCVEEEEKSVHIL